ncbi:hypothetical protein [Mucilaginibacter sp. L3T2-6]|uniref:hypothetical protein n=1 Tax=Mucilaginibacter sp. L3T2-6 TaxID=3062491 RepID=UPI002674AA23|nr:hypothetical protein [Mucilaginibacter sp. L3T2-6]MDO3645148.1 hypothetical protein [Mucilaginibacter sp. L3T2-6]MDV6217600.1 hypothetical protein [Mucilaginibacter sp. L3T2-6]
MITFNRFLDSQLFIVEANTDAGFFAYFTSAILDPSITSIDINPSWDDHLGFYVFLKTAPAEADLGKLSAALTTYFGTNYPSPEHTGFAWIDYILETSTIRSGTVLNTLAPEATVTIAEDVSFNFANYSMPLRQSAPVMPVKDNSDNIIAFTCEYPPYDGAPPPRQPYNIQIPLQGTKRGALTGQVSLGDFSTNADTGWNASLYYIINYNSQKVAQNYPLFETSAKDGLQVLFDYVLDPVAPLDPDRSYLAFTGTMFLLKQNNEGSWYIELAGQNALPSYFRTVYGKKVSLAPMTDSDHPPKLVFEELPPADGKPRYYLAPSGDFELVLEDSSASEELVSDYLLCGLSGAESVQFISKSAAFNGSVLRFVPKQNAYAPVFPIVNATVSKPANAWSAANAIELFTRHADAYMRAKASGNKELLGAMQGTQALLDSTYKTSWINIRPNPNPVNTAFDGGVVGLPNDTPVYYSQPNDAALYSHDGIVADVSNEMLQLKNIVAALFPAEVTQSMPVAPYSGVTAGPSFPYSDIQKFEKQVLIAARREAVSSIDISLQMPASLKAGESDNLVTTTPQGLLATVPNFGLNWQSVLLAKSVGKGIPYSLEFAGGVTKELRDVMQSNQMFLVASEAAPLGNFLNKITISDWPFTINVGKGSDQGLFSNVLIFKFAEGSLENRVKDPQSWASPSVFNQNAILVSKWITAYIETAKLNVKTDVRYANFLNIVQNPLWNGIIALKVDIGVENFPDDLKGLLAGINRDEFYAHHFGLEINFIEPDADGQLSLPKSSLFGLIDYVDKDYRTSQDISAHLSGDPMIFSVQEAPSPVTDSNGTRELYDFKVLTLQVVFENSEIKDFVSKIQLTTTAWFDEPGRFQNSNMGDSLGTQTIEFDGSYEKHNGVNTYTFLTQPNQTYKFVPESQTFNYIEIVKAQFYTITDQSEMNGTSDTGDTEIITSRFVFWGYMNFKEIDSFDMFSFGDAAGQIDTHNIGLYFANLYVGMSFVLDNVSGEATDRTFLFDPSRMSFDISQSNPRKNSLFTKFPINLSGLIYAKTGEESKPSDLGYLKIGIRSPTTIPGQTLINRWYSLLYNLNMGSMGALAAKAGFVSQISTAWSPDTAIKRLEAGIKLPGVGGQKTLSLQSVLSINIQSFTFISDYNDAEKTNLAYLLKFNNVKLSLLGKKLPGSADTQFILFGDATGVDKTTLAWYAAYYAKPKKTTAAIEETSDTGIQNI